MAGDKPAPSQRSDICSVCTRRGPCTNARKWLLYDINACPEFDLDESRVNTDFLY